MLAIILGALAAGGAFVSFRMGKPAKEAKLRALRNGMETLYDQSLSKAPPVEPGQQRRISAETISGALYAGASRRPVMPSFVQPSDVFLPTEGAMVPSEDLVCVVRTDCGALYGITARRVWYLVDSNRFAAWQHQPLSTNAQRQVDGNQ